MNYNTLITKINDTFKVIRNESTRVDVLSDIVLKEGFKHLASGLDCTVFTTDQDDYVVKVYHNIKDIRIPPAELLGNVFVDYHYFDCSRGLLIQKKVKPFNKSMKHAIKLYYDLGWHEIENIIDVSNENIGIDSDGKYKILDYGCYYKVEDYRNVNDDYNCGMRCLN